MRLRVRSIGMKRCLNHCSFALPFAVVDLATVFDRVEHFLGVAIGQSFNEGQEDVFVRCLVCSFCFSLVPALCIGHARLCNKRHHFFAQSMLFWS